MNTLGSKKTGKKKNKTLKAILEDMKTSEAEASETMDEEVEQEDSEGRKIIDKDKEKFVKYNNRLMCVCVCGGLGYKGSNKEKRN